MKINRLKPLLVLFVLIGVWQLCGFFNFFPDYILPTPYTVLLALIQNYSLLWDNMLVTLSEMFLGLFFGVLSGVLTAILLLFFKPIRPWLLPLIIATQAIPTFALAPIITLWLGYGISSKVMVTVIVIFFPVTICLFDGLQQTPKNWLALAQVMNATPWARFKYVQWPAALPVLGVGLRVAVVFVPIAAVIGEWTGSSAGLGYMMLQANARLWVDQMFAALFVLACCTVLLYYVTDLIVKKIIPWKKEI